MEENNKSLLPDEEQEGQAEEAKPQQKFNISTLPLLPMYLETIPLPEYFVFSDNLLAKEILEMELGKAKTLDVGGGITSTAIIGKKDCPLRGVPITGYDLVVMFAIDSLFNEEAYFQHEEDKVFLTFAPKEVTPAQIWRIFTHAKKSRTPSPEQCQMVRASIEKLSSIPIVIDCKDELERSLKRKGASLQDGPFKKGRIFGPLVYAKRSKGYSGGKYVETYHIEKPSPLYTYNNLINQERTVKAELLDIADDRGRRIPDTELRIIEKHYLLTRVETIKRKKKNIKKKDENSEQNIRHWNRISYETMYEEIAKRRKCFSLKEEKEEEEKEEEKNKEKKFLTVWEQAPDVLKGDYGRKLKSDLRKYASQVFDYWSRIGYIKETTPDPKKKYVDIIP